MKKIILFLAAAGLAAPRAGAEDAAAALKAGVAAYRAGKAYDAMDLMVRVLELDPGNPTAKNYLWTLARQQDEKHKALRLDPAELHDATQQALAILEERRRGTRAALDALARSYEATRDVRSPEEMLSRMEGLDRYLDAGFESERARAQAEAYFQKILENLTRALKDKTFVSKKDRFSAEATLAYYQKDWPGALDLWEKAAAEDPSDAQIGKNLTQLRRLFELQKKQEVIADLAGQAVTLERTRRYKEAVDAWDQVLGLAPSHAQALEGARRCRDALARATRAQKLKAKTDEGLALYRQGRYLEAAQTWLEVLQEEPGHEEARLWLTQVGKKLEKGRAAVNSAAAAQRETPAGAPPPDKEKAFELYKRGILLYSQDKVADAMELWRQAVALDPGLLKAQQAWQQAEWELSLQKREK